MAYTKQAQAFFDAYPAAHTAYAETKLYHLTHSQYLGSILEHGLNPGLDIFDPEEGEFLQRMYAKYGRGTTHESDYIRNRICASEAVYLSTETPMLEGFQVYGVPERLAYLMLGMKALGQKKQLSPAERDFAHQSFGRHHSALTAPGAEIVALQIDPLAPSVVNSLLGNIATTYVHDEDDACFIAQNAAGAHSYNIPVDAVEAPYISVHDRVSLVLGNTSLGIPRSEQSWLTEIH